MILLRRIGIGVWLLWRAVRGVAMRGWRGDPLLPAALADAFARHLWRPLPTIAALAGLAGLISGTLAARVLDVYNVETLVVGSLAETLLRQVLPLVIGVFASGSIAVELAARLGAMTVAGEIDALEAMGQEPAAFVLGPLSLAALAAAPVHMLIATVAALVAAGCAMSLSGHLSASELAQLVLDNDLPAALLGGAVKSLVFAACAFIVGCAVGAWPARVPADIGARARQAFTGGLLVIFAAATLWVALG